ncbi:hypothetical protein ACF0H5_024058 [Mactra antiquata]
MATSNRKFHLPIVVLLIATIAVPVPVESSSGNCILKGRIYTSLEWYGYLLQKTFQQNVSRIQYTVSYPVSECCASMLIYYDDQMRNLTQNMTCEQRKRVLPAVSNQVIPLNTDNGTVGCSIWKEEGKEPMNVCIGERTLKSSAPRTWYIAISRCGSSHQLTLNYQFNITGFYGNCEEDPLAKTFIPSKKVEENKSSLHAAIALGVVAGIAIIVAVVFIVLYILSRRQMQQKPKTSGSVTSSQATMTQDIFYVNPSLSDREHSDSQYSRSSSENYYEVIPDRRSYESINTQLALHGHGGRALNLAQIQRERGPRIPSYIFEDIPPPPYQPPNLQGHGHHHHAHAHQNSNSSGHQSQGSGSGHPLLGNSSPYSPGLQQHLPLTTRLLPISSQNGTLNGPVTMATTTRMPLHSSASGQMTSSNASSGPNHSSIGNFHSSAESSASIQDNQNGGITTSAGGLNSHNANTLPRSQTNEDAIPLQNGGPIQNGHGTIGRYPLHNTNHAKLLNHAYRIQQFETTA